MDVVHLRRRRLRGGLAEAGAEDGAKRDQHADADGEGSDQAPRRRRDRLGALRNHPWASARRTRRAPSPRGSSSR